MAAACPGGRGETVGHQIHFLPTPNSPPCRIDIQDRRRRLAREPREEDRKEVEHLRELLNHSLQSLELLRLQATGGVFTTTPTLPGDDPTAFDDMDENDEESRDMESRGTATRSQTAARGLDTGVPPIENQHLSIPSNWVSSDNPHRAVELSLRIIQADRTIQALRDGIADKSFQYSHVIRVAPRKSVRTRARATIAKLNNGIAYQSRVYGRCRAAMVRLGADSLTLEKYQILLKEHVKSSSALLNPNQPGSSRLQISWIWQSNVPGGESSPDRMRECESGPPQHFSYSFAVVNRVHWIRARAQKSRWKEEYTLVGYEMEWTVRYYLHHVKVWEGRATSSRQVGNAGATAYAIRKAAMWTDIATTAQAQFQRVNPRYHDLQSLYEQLSRV
jgi:hypothetical protein